MRRLVLWSVGTLVLCLAVRGALAQEQSQGDSRQEGAEAATKVADQGPNQTSAGLVGPQAEPNVQAVAAEQRERLRPSVNTRIRERVKERRRTLTGPVESRAARARPRSVVDANAPAGQHQQQLTAIEQQMSHEQAKHMDRLARLKRIRELAQQQGDTETLARVDKLLGQEQHRYDAKTQRMTHRKDRVVEFSEKAAQDKSKKAADADADKDSNRPQVEDR